MLKLDPVTRAEYDAGTTTNAKTLAVLNAIQDPVTVKVYNGDGDVVGSGTMATPWATVTDNTIRITDLDSFSVTTTATPDADWTIRFESETRWMEGSFGIAPSSQDFNWSLNSWTQGQTARMDTVVASTWKGSASTDAADWFNVASGLPVAVAWKSLASQSMGTITEGLVYTYDLKQDATIPLGATATFYLESEAISGVTLNGTTGIVTFNSSVAASPYSLQISISGNNGVTKSSRIFNITVSPAVESTRFDFARIPEIVFVEGYEEKENLGIWMVDPSMLWPKGDLTAGRHPTWRPSKTFTLRTVSGTLLGVTYNSEYGTLEYNGSGAQGWGHCQLVSSDGTIESPLFFIRVVRPKVVWGHIMPPGSSAADYTAKYTELKLKWPGCLVFDRYFDTDDYKRETGGTKPITQLIAGTPWYQATYALKGNGTKVNTASTNPHNPDVFLVMGSNVPLEAEHESGPSGLRPASNPYTKTFFARSAADRAYHYVIGEPGKRPHIRGQFSAAGAEFSYGGSFSNTPAIPAGWSRPYINYYVKNMEFEDVMVKGAGWVQGAEVNVHYCGCYFHDTYIHNPGRTMVDTGRYPIEYMYDKWMKLDTLQYDSSGNLRPTYGKYVWLGSPRGDTIGFSAGEGPTWGTDADDDGNTLDENIAGAGCTIDNPSRFYVWRCQFLNNGGNDQKHHMYVHGRHFGYVYYNGNKANGGWSCSTVKATSSHVWVANSHISALGDDSNPLRGSTALLGTPDEPYRKLSQQLVDFPAASNGIVYNNKFIGAWRIQPDINEETVRPDLPHVISTLVPGTQVNQGSRTGSIWLNGRLSLCAGDAPRYPDVLVDTATTTPPWNNSYVRKLGSSGVPTTALNVRACRLDPISFEELEGGDYWGSSVTTGKASNIYASDSAWVITFKADMFKQEGTTPNYTVVFKLKGNKADGTPISGGKRWTLGVYRNADWLGVTSYINTPGLTQPSYDKDPLAFVPGDGDSWWETMKTWNSGVYGYGRTDPTNPHTWKKFVSYNDFQWTNGTTSGTVPYVKAASEDIEAIKDESTYPASGSASNQNIGPVPETWASNSVTFTANNTYSYYNSYEDAVSMIQPLHNLDKHKIVGPWGASPPTNILTKYYPSRLSPGLSADKASVHAEVGGEQKINMRATGTSTGKYINLPMWFKLAQPDT